MGILEEVLSVSKIKGTINRVKTVTIIGITGIAITALLCTIVWKATGGLDYR